MPLPSDAARRNGAGHRALTEGQKAMILAREIPDRQIARLLDRTPGAIAAHRYRLKKALSNHSKEEL